MIMTYTHNLPTLRKTNGALGSIEGCCVESKSKEISTKIYCNCNCTYLKTDVYNLLIVCMFIIHSQQN